MNAHDIMMIIDKICEKEDKIGVIKIKDGDFKMTFMSNKAAAAESESAAVQKALKTVQTISAAEETEQKAAPKKAESKSEESVSASVETTAVKAGNTENTGNTENEEKTAGSTAAGNQVKSPLVGTFYVAPSEDAAPFVKVGDTVKKGQTIAIVEAMKLMNEIESDFDGVVKEILVENGTMVEYGQPLFIVG
ncbi:MAG: acetyl-CoA carboxylase biotin carboxyl carrier protein [Lachnospiraceae bacterium]|nr:acetyl-CoA carboxylase biotin carboxyl carrier protein [Lachnospiraceae bacterium]